jgi:hypothetical protein
MDPSATDINMSKLLDCHPAKRLTGVQHSNLRFMIPRHTTTAETPLRKLFVDQLADMHDAEKQLTKALFLMAKAAPSEDLKTLLKVHLKETKGHIETIEQVADSLREELPKKPAMR